MIHSVDCSLCRNCCSPFTTATADDASATCCFTLCLLCVCCAFGLSQLKRKEGSEELEMVVDEVLEVRCGCCCCGAIDDLIGRVCCRRMKTSLYILFVSSSSCSSSADAAVVTVAVAVVWTTCFVWSSCPTCECRERCDAPCPAAPTHGFVGNARPFHPRLLASSRCKRLFFVKGARHYFLVHVRTTYMWPSSDPGCDASHKFDLPKDVKDGPPEY